MYMYTLRIAVIENKQTFSPWLTELKLNWPQPVFFLWCASSLFKAAPLVYFWVLLSFLKEECEQHILSEGTVLCALSGLHEEQLNHLVTEAHTYYSVCVSTVGVNNKHSCSPKSMTVTHAHANIPMCALFLLSLRLSCTHILDNTWPHLRHKKKNNLHIWICFELQKKLPGLVHLGTGWAAEPRRRRHHEKY